MGHQLVTHKMVQCVFTVNKVLRKKKSGGHIFTN